MCKTFPRNIPQNPAKSVLQDLSFNPLKLPKNKEDARIFLPPSSSINVIPLGFDGRCGVWPIYGGLNTMTFIVGKTFSVFL